jgi:peptidyl-prolyl cis-trans isomerase B (cyclophilin B)
MNLVPAIIAMFSVLFPAKQYFEPGQAVSIQVKADSAITLVLTTFDGKAVAPKSSAEVGSGTNTVDLRTLYPQISESGTFVLLAVPKGKAPADFVGTPLVVEVLANSRAGAPPVAPAIRIEPLQYEVMTTGAGPLKMIFYYDTAPNAVESFLRLSSEGFYDGLLFHRIVPGFVIQGGDPRGDGAGGPGYSVDAEFSDRPHEEGVLSMARASDPNSAGSQFFVCLDYAQTKQLDHQYTVFGKVIEGMDAVKKIAATPIADAQNGKPATPQVIEKAEVFPVTHDQNPYADVIKLAAK